MVIYIINAESEKAYISSFSNLFIVLQDKYEVLITAEEYQNYEVHK